MCLRMFRGQYVPTGASVAHLISVSHRSMPVSCHANPFPPDSVYFRQQQAWQIYSAGLDSVRLPRISETPVYSRRLPWPLQVPVCAFVQLLLCFFREPLLRDALFTGAYSGARCRLQRLLTLLLLTGYGFLPPLSLPGRDL